MLKLRKGKPPFVPIALGGDAVMRVRAATQADVDHAAARAQRDLMGLVAGSEAGTVLTAILGDDFKVGALSDTARIAAAGERLSEIYLLLACQDGWRGIGNENGEPIEEPDPATIALLLNDPRRRARIVAVMNAEVHEEIFEKNASAASPNGGADIPTGAPPAAATASPAPSV
jgi:hypothetical protein